VRRLRSAPFASLQEARPSGGREPGFLSAEFHADYRCLADDLELLMRVLDANKALFAKADRLEPEAKTDRPAIKLAFPLTDARLSVSASKYLMAPRASSLRHKVKKMPAAFADK
jgi:hypothetical protein